MGTLAAVCLTSALPFSASAEEYSFSGAAETEFYPSKSYESVYGSAYHYGGRNVIDFTYPELPFGTVSNTLIGAMEKAPLYGRTPAYNPDGPFTNYGIVDVSPISIYEAMDSPATVSATVSDSQVIYQQTAYTSTAGMAVHLSTAKLRSTFTPLSQKPWSKGRTPLKISCWIKKAALPPSPSAS